MLLLLTIPLPVVASQYQHPTKIVVSGDKEQSHLILTLPFKTNYYAFLLTKPDRLVLDLSTTGKLTVPVNNLNFSKTIITSIKTNPINSNQLRLVINLHNPVIFKCQSTTGNNLIINLLSKSLPNKKNNVFLNTADLPKIVASKPKITKPKITALTKFKPHNIVIVIDPGHGGKDSGAVGITGVQEKNVVLRVSKYLKQYLDQQSGFKTFLTRNDDYFIPLRGRLSIASKYKADMFIAIHADAYNNLDATGASVFALSERGATSELARFIAKKENESELGHVIADKNLLLKSVLVDLAQTLTIDNSVSIGNSILRQLSLVTDLHCHHIEQAGFVVLKSPDIPSLLVETGFLTNFAEEKRLNTSEYQQKIAFALAQGIKNYFLNTVKN